MCGGSSPCTPQHETVTHTMQDLNARGWRTKSWTTRAGHVREGVAWTKCTLRKLLANPTYIGCVKLKAQVFEGEHPAIVAPDVFKHAQELLARGSRKQGKCRGGRPSNALLAGLLRCAPCNAAMTPGYTRRGRKVYRYYLCRTAQKENWAACPHPSVRTHEIEALVIEQVRAIGRDKALQARVLDAVREQDPEVHAADLRRALTLFDPVWEVLHTREQSRILKLLIAGISFDGAAGTAVVAFRAAGIQALAEEIQA